MNLREPHVQRGIGGVVLVIVIIWLVYFTDYLPFFPKHTSVEVSKLRNELQTLGGELQRARTSAESIPALERELAQMEAKWAALKGMLPKATEMSMLLTEVTSSGLQSGVEFTLFQPQAPEPAELYTRYPIRVVVTGSYHQVGNFLDNLYNMDRLVGISDVGLAQIEKGLTAATVEATAMIFAYTYNEEPRKIEEPQASPGQKVAPEQPAKTLKE